MEPENTIPSKALIYATCSRGLLIFTEPKFPDVPPQVPGGTIDPGETPAAAAKREFREETGLPAPAEMSFLCLDRYRFDHAGQSRQINRYYFHTTLSDQTPDSWDHYERFAHDGAAPILFRYSWMPLGEASQALGIGLDAAVHLLAGRIAGMP